MARMLNTDFGEDRERDLKERQKGPVEKLAWAQTTSHLWVGSIATKIVMALAVTSPPWHHRLKPQHWAYV